MPRVNWTLLAARPVLVFIFRSSSALASAYGIAVTGTMVVTSLLAFAVFRRAWRWPLAAGARRCWCRCSRSSSIFLGANLAKLLDGGYVPLIIAGVVGLLMTTWVRGTRDRPAPRRAPRSVSLEQLIAHAAEVAARAGARHRGLPHLRPGRRARGAAAQPQAQPRAARAQRHRHRHASATTPRVADAERIDASSRSPTSFWRMRLTFGYMEMPNVPKALALARQRRAQLRDDEHLLLPQPPLVPALTELGDAALAGQALHRR